MSTSITGDSIGTTVRHYLAPNQRELELRAYMYFSLLLLQTMAWGLLWKLGWVRRWRQEEIRDVEVASLQ